ncbi:MAG: hypothetical protein K8W52_05820 [Deltaproteobacteria bacterium]|nr:hypothetical protein [Deltaproteobacteria bacterium]
MRLASIGWIIAAVAITGCAAGATTQRPATARTSQARSQARIAAIEYTARQRGLQVIWVHPPDAH